MAGFEAQEAERCGVHGEVLTFDHRQADPSRGQHTAKLSVREECDRASQFAQAGDHLVCARTSRIINEVRGINRVTYDVSSKPPATIEWE